VRPFGILKSKQWANKPAIEGAHEATFVKPFFKSCGRFHRNMRITDPRWPAVREAARRLVREPNALIQGPDWLEQEVHSLGVVMGDKLPARLTFPSCLPVSDQPIALLDGTTHRIVVQCSQDEPPPEVVWIPLEGRAAWEAIKTTALDLIRAGYPGCVGCAGSEAEQPWDESQNRQALQEFRPNRS
jgi:hypothetical protein